MAYQSPISKLSKYFGKMEGIALAAFAVGYLLKILHYPGQQLIIISLSALAVIYFLGAYVPAQAPEDGDEQSQPKGFAVLLGETIIPKLLGIGSAVAVIGILFTIQHFNGFREMLLIGSSTLGVSSIVGLLVSMNNEKARASLSNLLFRAVPLMLIGIYLLRIYGISPPVN
ncbi:MAG TPA: hypothetical protein DGG95_00795 [Cytophagales bacterium]|jgi:hypothetical protein|nr:hypothetical protein [Cytophagales bacterium]